MINRNLLKFGIIFTFLMGLIIEGCNCRQNVGGRGDEHQPDAPTVNNPGVVCEATFTVTGTKPSSTSIQIDEKEIVPFDESDQWSANLTVEDGNSQSYSVVAVDKLGIMSEPTIFEVTVNDEVPTAPTTQTIPVSTTNASLTIEGTKQAGTSIWADGEEKVPADNLETYSFTVTLEAGDNTIVIVASNECNDSNTVTVEIEYIPVTVNVTIQDPADGSFVSGEVTIVGTASSEAGVTSFNIDRVDISIDAGAAVNAQGTDNWTYEWDTTLLDDFSTHTISVQAFDENGNSSEVVTADVLILAGTIVISDATGNGESWRPAVAVSPNSPGAYIAWHDDGTVDGAEGLHYQIYLRTIIGANLGNPIRISTSDKSGNSQNVTLAVDNLGVAHIIWQDKGSYDDDGNNPDDDIVYNTYDGNVVGSTSLISKDTWDGESRYPHVVIDPIDLTTLHLVWQENGNADGDNTEETDILYSKKTGNDWSNPWVVSVETAGANIIDSFPRVAVDTNQNVHVVWQCEGNLDTNGTDDIDICYSKRSADDNTWSTPALVSDTGTDNCLLPDIAADLNSTNDTVYIVWGKTNDIHYRKKDGDVFGPFNTELSDDAADTTALSPTITTDGLGNFAIGWVTNGDINSTGTDHDIFLRRLTDSLGDYESISDLDDNSTNTGVSQAPDSVMDQAGNLFVVWQDKSDIDGNGTDFDIFLTVK